MKDESTKERAEDIFKEPHKIKGGRKNSHGIAKVFPCQAERVLSSQQEPKEREREKRLGLIFIQVTLLYLTFFFSSFPRFFLFLNEKK